MVHYVGYCTGDCRKVYNHCAYGYCRQQTKKKNKELSYLKQLTILLCTYDHYKLANNEVSVCCPTYVVPIKCPYADSAVHRTT